MPDRRPPHPPRPSKPAFWTGAAITGLTAAFLIVDGAMKLLRLPPAVEGTLDVGYPDSTVRPIGAVLLVAVAFHLVPRTAVLGAILLTGYLGGAVATHVRLEDPWFTLPAVVGALVWLALLLREPRLRTVLPLRRPPEAR